MGRGPIAGPVMVCACAFNPVFRKKLSFVGLRDSKKMTAKAREAWVLKANEWQKKGIISYTIAKKSAAFIDKNGIAKAIRESVSEVLEKLEFDPKTISVLLDGSLFAPHQYKQQKTIIKGDDKHVEISLASVIAKVTRDALMQQLYKKYSHYAWHKNKGYGTKEHYRALQNKGITPLHRKSFLKKSL